MIFVTLGSQKFQFNRLLTEIDRLISTGVIQEEVFAQIGYSNYCPENFRYKKFIDRDEFNKVMSECDIVITHGGTGAIINAVKKEKKVIAIPRLSKYKEHVDDHQMQITKEFTKLNFIVGVIEIEELRNVLMEIENIKLNKYESNTRNIIESINNYIDDLR